MFFIPQKQQTSLAERAGRNGPARFPSSLGIEIGQLTNGTNFTSTLPNRQELEGIPQGNTQYQVNKKDSIPSAKTRKEKKLFPGGKDKYSSIERSGARQADGKNSIAKEQYKRRRDSLKIDPNEESRRK